MNEISVAVGVVLGILAIIWFEINEDRIVRAWIRLWHSGKESGEGDNR